MLASPDRRQRLQAARIDAVDGHVGARRFVGGGAQAGLVLDAVAGQAAGEVEHGLALVDALEALRDRADGEQLAVGVEAVVLGVVGGEAGCVVGGAVGGAGRRRRPSPERLVAVVLRQPLQQRGLVGGEVLVHAQAGATG